MFKITESILSELSRRIPGISVAVGAKKEIIYSKAFGEIRENNKRITTNTLFDIASMTKIISGIAFMKMIEEGYFNLKEPICNNFPEFNCVKSIEADGRTVGMCDCSKITWYHVLTHTTGMGWTRPKTRPSLPNLNVGLSDIYEMPMAYNTGEHIVYSDIPIILMGKAMEMKMGMPLDDIVYKMVIKPLQLKNTRYIRDILKEDLLCIAPTEYDNIFRKCRVHGVVHDENAYLLGGVSAHAGIFSTAEDMCKIGNEFLRWMQNDGLLKNETALNMILPHESEKGDTRGLIWQINSNRDEFKISGLSSKAFGHSGFTGCFMWIDPEIDIVIVLLSNDIYNGREKRCMANEKKKIINSIIYEYKRQSIL